MVFCEYKIPGILSNWYSVEYEPVASIYRVTEKRGETSEVSEYDNTKYWKFIRRVRDQGFVQVSPYEDVNMNAA